MKKFLSILLSAALVFGGFALAENQAYSAESISVPAQAVSGTAEACECEITFDGSSASIYGGSAKLENGVLTISESGSYLLTGEFEGTVEIDVSKDKKVNLCLNGVVIESKDGPAVNVLSAPKNVTFTLCEGSVNIVRDSDSAYASEDGADAAIYSKEDLKFEGTGVLYVVSAQNKGIHSTDDIKFLSGEVYVVSEGTAVQGKDSVTVSGGVLRVESGADGIKSTNEEDEEKGNIVVSGGAVYGNTQGDGLSAVNTLAISGGSVYVQTGSGCSSTSKSSSSSSYGRGGMGGFGGMGGHSSSSAGKSGSDSVSQKALKAGKLIEISGGFVSISSEEDALHSNGSVTVSGGEILIYAGDDALHADSVLTISGGEIQVESSYEGLEATVVNITGGNVHVNASDDGINAAGDDDSVTTSATSNSYGGRMGGMMGGNGLGEINISGGYTVVNADGDGIDSNNFVTMSGGTLLVYGPTNSANGALDYETSFTMTGGTVLAVGASGMAETVSESENVGVLAFSLRSSLTEMLTVTDGDGSEIICFASPKSYSSCVYASADLTSGDSYSVYSGGTRDGLMVDYIYMTGTTQDATLLGSISAK